MDDCISHKSPLVAIILSTFNGELYLEEQLDSLLNQTHKNINILIRDDGSNDGTKNILNRYASKHPNIKVLFEENIGVVGSFLQLIKTVPLEVDYVALCDQDDVWFHDKIERALLVMSGADQKKPILYCGAINIVDENLKHIRTGNHPRKKLSIGNSLVENIATGCTIVINNTAIQLIKNKNALAENIAMHDWWLYQVVTTFGCVIFDSEPKIYYRQHLSNLVGSFSGFKLWRQRAVRQLGTNKKVIRFQAEELLRAYGSEMPSETYDEISNFLIQTDSNNIFTRLSYITKKSVFRQRVVDDVILQILIFLRQI